MLSGDEQRNERARQVNREQQVERADRQASENRSPQNRAPENRAPAGRRPSHRALVNRALVKKCIRDAQWLWLACAAAIYAFCWVRVWMVSRLDTQRFQAIIDLLPGDWQRFTPVDMSWLVTYAGRISLAYDEPIVVFGVSIWAIARGSDCVSGELNRGTLEMLLAQPLSRLQLLVTQGTVTVVGTALLALVAWLGTWTGIQTTSIKEEVRPAWSLPFSLPIVGREITRPFSPPKTVYTPMTSKVEARLFLPASVTLFSLGMMLCGVTTFVSACDRYRWRTIGIVCGAYVVQTIMKLVGMASDSWKWLTYLSVFTPYEPEEFVHLAIESPDLAWSFVKYDAAGQWAGLGPLGFDLILVGIGYLAYMAAAVIFHRRDLPAPT